MKDTFSWEKIESTDDDHIQIRVETQDYGEYHIRIRNLNRDAHFYLKGVKDEYTKIATYYERVNFVYSQKVPGFYQYRYFQISILE